MSSQGEPQAFVGAEAAARAIGHLCWWERRSAALLGGWTRSSAHPAAVSALFDLSSHCAWRAERWAEWAPRVAAFPSATLVVPASPQMAARFDEMSVDGAGRASAQLDLERLQEWRVTHLATHSRMMSDLLRRTDDLANRPLRRGLVLMLADVDLDDRLLEQALGELRTSP